MQFTSPDQLAPHLPEQASAVALKEWDVVCTAVRTGRQHLLFRTGGIAETTDGFEPRSPSFWLYPTHFHQRGELLAPEYQDWWNSESSSSTRSPSSSTTPGEILVQDFCRVRAVHRIEQLALLERLARWHLLHRDVLEQRFQYRQPGLFVLVVEAWKLPEAVPVPHQNAYDGCHSWVELTTPLATAELQPVVPVEQVDRLVFEIAELIRV